jgi:hypothetical protein
MNEEVEDEIIREEGAIGETAFIFISKHGTYELEDSLEFDIISCPIANLIRFQYSPIGTCSFGSFKTDIPTYFHLYNEFKNPNTNIIQTLENIGEQNKCSNYITQDYVEIHKTGLDPFEKKICKTRTNNKIIENKFGDLLLNKTYQVDTKPYDVSGIAILCNVSFILPDIFFNGNNKNKLDRLIEDLIHNPPQFRIGIYNDTTRKITYESNTELLSCPFFLLFYKLLNDINVVKNEAMSITDELDFSDMTNEYVLPTHIGNSPRGTPRYMIFEVNSYTIYNYFQYVNTLVNIDYSCGYIELSEEQQTRLKKMGKEKAEIKRKKTLRKLTDMGVSGGSKTKRNKTKRNKNKSRKIKRNETKRNKNKSRKTKRNKS